MRRVLVTGASGFVGQALVERLVRDGAFVPRAASRGDRAWKDGVESVRVGDLGPDTDWGEAFAPGADGGIPNAVVHLAARVHVMRESVEDPLEAFREVNVAGTLNLARQAAEAGVSRFVYVSSIKVNGERSRPGVAFTADDMPHPEDPYGISKWEAEQGLRALSRETGLDVVLVRPPLVYGPGVKANFLRLMRLVQRGIPQPLGAVYNHRSLVCVDNLVDLLVHCLDDPRAAGETFLVSDDEDLSTPGLIREIASAMGRPARLLPVPVSVLRLAGRLSGRSGVVERLCGSLRVDISKTRELLDWTPPLSVQEGIRRTVEHYLAERRSA